MHRRRPVDIFLQPGEYYVGDSDCRIRTLLGSCVSITLWHPRKRMGAMTHFLLASRGLGRVGELDAKYGEDAMYLILQEFARARVAPRECQAKIFGGGNMFPKHTKLDSALNIGQKNGEAARRLVSAQGIAIISESLFGVGHRQIIFDVGYGHVWSRQIKPVVVALTA